jgi:hypothetical protein
MFKQLLLLLTLLPCAAFSQTIPASPAPGSATICLTVPQAATVRDSLNKLPIVRRETRSLRTAVGQYRQAANAANTAYVEQVQATSSVRLALRESKIETVRQEVNAKEWKGKARRRGLLNWLAGALVVAISYTLIIH